MPGDVERVTFRPDLRFANVELQQGRLLLPAEFNEQSAIQHHFLRTFIADMVGPRWRAGTGFTITTDAATALRLHIEKGRYYIDGILCENRITRAFESQPFAPTPDDPSKLTTEAAVYLDCWERHVTWLNYPSLRDPALGGADSATRVQIAWQVRLLLKDGVSAELESIVAALNARVAVLTAVADAAAKKALQITIADIKAASKAFDPTDCATVAAVLDLLDKARPNMAADAKIAADNPDPCAIAPDSDYRGRENQLYRVEIHRPGLAGGPATYKWSRENGSVAFKIIDIVGDTTSKVTTVTLESLGRDRRTGVCEGDWIELVDDDSEFQWLPLPLLQVAKVDVQRRIVTLNGTVDPPVTPTHHALMRRWDHVADDKADGAVIVKESKDDLGWLDLERGVKIRFAPGGWYRKGDYWLIPTRVATGDVEWPTDGTTRLLLEPGPGATHHRAALATLTKNAKGWSVPNQCGCTRKPLCNP
jgi:hypothetical protein